MSRIITLTFLAMAATGMAAATATPAPLGSEAAARDNYAIVISKATAADDQWMAVVRALIQKHQAEYKVQVFVYKDALSSLQPALSRFAPKYVCFVATPEEAGRGGGRALELKLEAGEEGSGFVHDIYDLTRHLDDDPYGDAIWAILTGYEPADALRIAQYDKPIRVEKALSGKFGYIGWFKEGRGYSERLKGVGDFKFPGEAVFECKVPDDATESIVASLNSNTYDMFDTCGHANEHKWLIGFEFKSGILTHENGQLFGQDLQGNRYPIHTDRPMIYYGEGNCLIGDIDRRDCMATSWIHSGGAYQYGGYVVENNFGYMGWVVFWNFVMPGDQFTFPEASFVSNQALLMGLQEKLPEVMDDEQVLKGCLFEKDCIAIYGDPACDARIAKPDTPWLFEPALSYKPRADGRYDFTFRITATRDGVVFDPTGFYGSSSAATLLPFRIANVRDITTDTGGKTVVTDNFVLMQVKGTLNKGDVRTVTFTAKKLPAAQ